MKGKIETMKNRNIIFTAILLGLPALRFCRQRERPIGGPVPSLTRRTGDNALFSLTTGAANTAFGWFSLFSDADGSFNTGVGAGTLLFNNAGDNTAVGAAALYSTLPAPTIRPLVRRP